VFVKHWSSVGQKLVKYWSGTGQVLVRHWSSMVRHWSSVGHVLVKCWSGPWRGSDTWLLARLIYLTLGVALIRGS